MRKLILAASALMVGMVAAYADPVEDREALMKSFGKAVGQLAPIAKGEKPFDAAEVKAGLEMLNTQAQKFDAAVLFPEGTLGESASPKIWEDWAGFTAAVDKFKGDVAEAAGAPPTELAAFQATFGKVAGNCGACHEAFRVKKN